MKDNKTNLVNIAFFGTSDRSIHILEALKNCEDFNIGLCVTKSDTKVGRNQNVRETAVKTWCKNNNVLYMETNSLKDDNQSVVEQLTDSKIQIGVVVDFSFIIPQEIIETPKFGLINIHFSMLPKWRGASPIQFAILNGDTTTGITFHLVDKKMDKGDILYQIGYKILGHETSGELYGKLFEVAGENVVKVVKGYLDNSLKPTKQDELFATTTLSPTHPASTFIYKEDAFVDAKLIKDNPEKVERMVRAFDPWPIAWTTLADLAKGLNLKIAKTKSPDLKIKLVQTNIENGLLKVQKLQVEGKKVMDWKSFENGYLTI